MGSISNIDFFKDAIKNAKKGSPKVCPLDHEFDVEMYDMTIRRTDYKNVRHRIHHFYDNKKKLRVKCEDCYKVYNSTQRSAAFRMLHFGEECRFCLGFM